MRDYLAIGHRLRKSGSYHRAIKYYFKASHRSRQLKEQNACAYMIAFTYVLLAHHTRNETCLGVDLRHPCHDLFHEASKQLDQLDREFDPKAYGLPALTAYEKKKIDSHRD